MITAPDWWVSFRSRHPASFVPPNIVAANEMLGGCVPARSARLHSTAQQKCKPCRENNCKLCSENVHSTALPDLLPLTTEPQGDKPPKPANAIVAGAEIK